MTKKIVYILGAGSSKDFGLPLGNEIFDYANKILELKRQPIYDKLVLLIAKVDEYLNQLFINLPVDRSAYPPFEEVLTLIWDTKKSEYFDYHTNKLISLFETEHGAEEVTGHFVNMLLLTLTGSMILFSSTDDINLYRQFIKSLNYKENEITFISLNYDLILDNILEECIAEGLINDFTYGLPLCDATKKYDYNNRSENFIKENGIQLLKPHGSLNLVNCPRHKHTTCGWGFYLLTKDWVNKSEPIQCPGCGHPVSPLIIPPLYNKVGYIENTKPKTQRVVQRSTIHSYRYFTDEHIGDNLRNADEIIVIGYSMPAYDYDFKSMLITNLMLNKKREKVHLKIITKDENSHDDFIARQYKYLVGKITVESKMGFKNYLEEFLIHG